jgi:protein AroM
MKIKLGMVTIGQAPRVDVVPDMADLLGSSVEIVERGALDDLSASEIATLAPTGDDDVLVTRLADGQSVFVAKRHITPRVQRKIAALEAEGVAMTVLLCTGKFPALAAARPLVEPDKVLLGVIRGIKFNGRLGVLTPSERHVSQAEARWTSYGFDPVVAAASPYREAASIPEAAVAFRARGAGLVVLDCIGFRREARVALQEALGVPVIVANLLMARIVAELLGV